MNIKTKKVSFRINEDLFLNLLGFNKKEINNYLKLKLDNYTYESVKNAPYSAKGLIYNYFSDIAENTNLGLSDELLDECLNQLKEYISKRYDHYIMTRFMKGEK